MASEKYLWIEGEFLDESHINLDDVGMSLASAQQTQATSTYTYCLYLTTNTMRILSSLAVLDHKSVGKKKK